MLAKRTGNGGKDHAAEQTEAAGDDKGSMQTEAETLNRRAHHRGKPEAGHDENREQGEKPDTLTRCDNLAKGDGG